ncbi:MAG: TrkH family potassium uptake protein [Thermoguttaceae bacterium]
MNIRLVSWLLGIIAFLLGASMIFSVPWSTSLFGGNWAVEKQGVFGLIAAMIVCLAVGIALCMYGRDAKGQLFRKEALAVVGLSWVLATVLGGLPYLFGGVQRAVDVRMSFLDCCFESQSGFSTTGATVLSELEKPQMVPRCILFWRSTTHFLGGMGIMVLFVAILGQGLTGKAMMKAEMTGPRSSNTPTRMRQTATTVCSVYLSLNVILIILLLIEGLTPFDAICHSFATISTGGFSTHNASVGYFAAESNLNADWIEWTFILFMFLGGCSFFLIHAAVWGRPGQLFGNTEWKVYTGIILTSITLIVLFGMWNHDFTNFGTSDYPIRGPIRSIAPIIEEKNEEVPPDFSGLDSGDHSQVDLVPDWTESSETEGNSERTVSSNDSSATNLLRDSSLGNDSSIMADSSTDSSIESSTDSTIEGANEENNFAVLNIPELQSDDLESADPKFAVSWYYAIRDTSFQVVSIITTTGFCTDEFEKWNGLSRWIIILLMIFGGCAGSTAGGVKIIRVVIGWKVMKQAIESSFRPNLVRSLKVSGKVIEKDSAYSVLVYLFLVVVIIALSIMLVLALEPTQHWVNKNLDSQSKLVDVGSCVLATVGNVGPGFGVIGARQNYGGFSEPTKLYFVFLMMLGRLEMFAVLALFHPAFWRKH